MHTFKTLVALGLSVLATGVACAAPTLRGDVDVTAKVVTVGDLFAGAGDLATRPLFLAPAPGTSGEVPILDVRIAANKVGLVGSDDEGVDAVRVSRLATLVDQSTLTDLIRGELKTRGVLNGSTAAGAAFDTRINGLVAAAVPDPVQLVNLNYAPDTGLFAVRFQLAGNDQPLDLTGRIDLMVDVPELTATLAAGTILKPSDISLQPVSLRIAQNGNVATMDQLVGKQLQRQSRAGMMLKVSDVGDPELIGRNDLVTVYLHQGPLTLTIKGTALNAASLGQPVTVLNATSKKMVHGVARADGAVEVTAAPTTVAGL